MSTSPPASAGGRQPSELASVSVLDSPEGEIALLTAILTARPVGLNKHFAMVTILKIVEHKLGEGRVDSAEVWRKLGELYDLSMLDEDVRADQSCLLGRV